MQKSKESFTSTMHKICDFVNKSEVKSELQQIGQKYKKADSKVEWIIQ